MLFPISFEIHPRLECAAGVSFIVGNYAHHSCSSQSCNNNSLLFIHRDTVTRQHCRSTSMTEQLPLGTLRDYIVNIVCYMCHAVQLESGPCAPQLQSHTSASRNLPKKYNMLSAEKPVECTTLI